MAPLGEAEAEQPLGGGVGQDQFAERIDHQYGVGDAEDDGFAVAAFGVGHAHLDVQLLFLETQVVEAVLDVSHVIAEGGDGLVELGGDAALKRFELIVAGEAAQLGLDVAQGAAGHKPAQQQDQDGQDDQHAAGGPGDTLEPQGGAVDDAVNTVGGDGGYDYEQAEGQRGHPSQ